MSDLSKRSDWKAVIACLNTQIESIRVNVVQMNKVSTPLNGQPFRMPVTIAPAVMTNQAIRFSYNQPLAYKKSLKQLIQDAPVFAPHNKPLILHNLPPMPPKHITIEQRHPQIVPLTNFNPSSNKQAIVMRPI